MLKKGVNYHFFFRIHVTSLIISQWTVLLPHTLIQIKALGKGNEIGDMPNFRIG